jgi:ElaB/YqjD/DUF883 family membrane-anchored ribosome-binding protein
VSYEISNEQLNTHFRAALADAEALVKATANLGGEALVSARSRAEESLKTLRGGAAEAQAELVARAKAAATATDSYVHEKPWEVIAMAAGVGFFLGVFVARR